MKYFLDTEFIERPNTIDLISLGIKCEDGRSFYAESCCFDERKAGFWVKQNVIQKLRWYGNPESTKGFCNATIINDKTEVFGTLVFIRDKVREFIGDDIPEFWTYYGSYDWVVFCWLFGTLVYLPKGWPQYCNDLKQLADEIGCHTFERQEEDLHNALADAIWNEKFYEQLKGFEVEDWR